jgi:hypothetical protein
MNSCKEIVIDGKRFIPAETEGEQMRIVICDNLTMSRS